ncbi:MAG: P27 family phage terminase small subunit [Pseudohongiella sp.]|nr:P27 family phage terminase small subunit [Pseudohongiella sp.]
MGILTDADFYALESLCDCFTDMLDCRDLIARQGRTYELTIAQGEKRVRMNPAVHQLQAAHAQFNEYLVEFGIRPDSTRVIDIDASDDDLLAQLLNRAA